MCGICGAVGTRVSSQTLRDATDTMLHRGPDEAGYYLADGVALGMRRLSIIDLAGGQQPKTDESGRLQVVFNGEIYNFRELRTELRRLGCHFRTDSDTEVIAHAYAVWGSKSFVRLNGIFAVAIWDRERQELILARDHLGVKPLYYAAHGTGLVFGSELKPLVALLPNRPSIDVTSTALYLQYGYIPAPRSIYEDVSKLPPGHLLIKRRDASAIDLRAFWDPVQVSQAKQAVSLEDAENRVDDALRRAVKRQMISDVPLGAFLSGGVDSSVVVAMMQLNSEQPAKTFSIGFRETEADESHFAEQVARHLGTDHHSWTITDADALAVVPRLPAYFDEPFADSSAIPTYLVSQLARRHVTVSLSGDGGDELFGGYPRYARLYDARHWWRIPAQLRVSGLALGSSLPGAVGRAVRQKRDAGTVAAHTLSDAYRYFATSTGEGVAASLLTAHGESLPADPGWPRHLFTGRDLNEAMMLTDLQLYLPDDILTKVDRASMAHSLEARVPLLDVEFVELALSLPTRVRLSEGPKSILKNVLKRYVPAELVDRPKHGFGIPLDEWLRGGLREHLLDYLAPSRLAAHGLFQTSGVEHLLREHLSSARDWSPTLWAILTFQMWYEEHGHGVQLPAGHHCRRMKQAVS